MRLKIVGDGTAFGTQIINADTGEPLSLVQSLSYTVDVATHLATVTLTVLKVPIELSVDGTEVLARELTLPVKDSPLPRGCSPKPVKADATPAAEMATAWGHRNHAP